jgi:hypothetical protein
MDRSHILQTANQYIAVDRAATHGKAEDSFSEIAKVWTWWLGGRLSAPLTPHDVAMMMGLFKDARVKGNAEHLDNYIDGCGYRALAGEMATTPHTPEAEK